MLGECAGDLATTSGIRKQPPVHIWTRSPKILQARQAARRKDPTTLVANLWTIAPGQSPILVPNAVIRYQNNGAPVSVLMPDGRLTLSKGTEFEPLVFPIRILGRDAQGNENMNNTTLSADLRDVYRTGRDPVATERVFLDLVADLGLGVPTVYYQALALAPSADHFLQALENAADATALEALLPGTHVEFVASTGSIEGHLVTYWLKTTERNENGGDPWLPLGFLPAPPPDVITSPEKSINLRKDADKYEEWNPGRSARSDDTAANQRSFTGLILVNEDLQRRAHENDEDGNAGETIHFKGEDELGEDEIRPMSALTLLKTDIFHEMNVRLWDIRGRGNYNDNTRFDEGIIRLYPNINAGNNTLSRRR